jgi:antitoxin (DNA-binding transcriptional repressor) of toxin-antitoxin stability system
MATVTEVTDPALQFADLIRQVQAGKEFVLTQAGKPVARLAPVQTPATKKKSLPPLKFATFSGPTVLTPNISRADIAEDIFSRE